MANKPGFDTDTGRGGETHQRVPKRGSHGAEGHLTTNQGIRVSDNQNSLKAGVRGPTLLEDFVLREKIFHFDHGSGPWKPESPSAHAPARYRLQARQRRPRHARDPALPRAPEHHAHRPLHRDGAGEVQEFLEGLRSAGASGAQQHFSRRLNALPHSDGY